MKLGLWSWSSFRVEAGVDLAGDVGGGVGGGGAEVDVGEACVFEGSDDRGVGLELPDSNPDAEPSFFFANCGLRSNAKNEMSP